MPIEVDPKRPRGRLSYATLRRSRLVRFALVGASSTAISLAVYALLLAVSVPYLLAGLAAYGVGILNGYTWNRVWTFETGPFSGVELGRYASVQGIAAAANVGGLALAVEVADLGELASEAAVLPPLILITYLINRDWTFRARSM